MPEVPLPRNRAEQIAEAREANKCPIEWLDWYRLPKVFEAMLRVFGKGMYNDNGRTRKVIDKEILWACDTWKQKYGECTTQRCQVCQDLIHEALEVTAQRPRHIPPQPWFLQVLRRHVNHEETHERLKATREVPVTTFNAIFHKLED